MKATVSSVGLALRRKASVGWRGIGALSAAVLCVGAPRIAPAVEENPSNGHIAYEHKEGTGTRDIWYMKADGSGKKKLATDGTWPCWRPDGTKISYKKNDETWVMNPDGSGQARLSGLAPIQWWGTAQHLCKNATGDVYKVDYPSGSQSLVCSKSQFTRMSGYVFGPTGLTHDGRWLVTITDYYRNGRTGDNGYFDAYWSAVMLDMNDKSKIYFIESGCEPHCPVSGDYIYHVNGKNFPETAPYRINKGDTSRSTYTAEIDFPDSNWGHEYFPRTSTDNQWLVYGATTGSPACHDHDTCPYQIFIHRLGGGNSNRKQLTNDGQNNRWPHCFVGNLPSTNNPPTVSITDPANGASFTAPADVAVTAVASDSDGSVSKVDLYVNGVFNRTENSAPYEWTLAGLGEGSYTLTAVATDDDGATKTSSAVTVTVTATTEVSIDSFTANPSTINEGQSSTLSWTTSNATSVSINQGIGTVAADGSRSVSPTSTTTYTLTAQGTGGPVSDTVTVTVQTVQPVSVPFRMNCGVNSYTPSGWAEDDAYVSGGTDYENWPNAISTAGVANAAPDSVYETVRHMSPHTYTIPIANGSYVVRMHFCEGYSATSTRDVKYVVEGVTVEDHMDYATEAGAHFLAVAKDYDVAVADGDIVIECTDYSTDVFEAGIEILDGGGTTEPTIALIQPNGGEVWYVGTTRHIKWSTVAVDDVAISYYNASWKQIAPTVRKGDAGWGSYPWLIPDDPGTDCRLSISDYLDPDLSVQSAGTFEIRSVTDSDDDGMDDGWEMQHFGDLTHDGTVDTDGDGLTDLQEFGRASDPNDPNDPGDAPGESSGSGFGCLPAPVAAGVLILFPAIVALELRRRQRDRASARSDR